MNQNNVPSGVQTYLTNAVILVTGLIALFKTHSLDQNHLLALVPVAAVLIAGISSLVVHHNTTAVAKVQIQAQAAMERLKATASEPGVSEKEAPHKRTRKAP